MAMQAGISSKNKNDPRLENELKAVSPNANSVCREDDFFNGIADFERTSLRRFEQFQPHSPPGMRRRVPCVRYKLTYMTRNRIEKKKRTILALVVKNKNDPGWVRLPSVLRHPTVL